MKDLISIFSFIDDKLSKVIKRDSVNMVYVCSRKY